MAQFARVSSRHFQAISGPVRLPPSFLVPCLSVQQSTHFSSTAPNAKRKTRRDGNPKRGISAIRHTGPGKRASLSVDIANLPRPVAREPLQKSETTEKHGLWGFFDRDRNPLPSLEDTYSHGRGWTVNELRNKRWEDLHRLWWVCIKERNRIFTMEGERRRLGVGYGEHEAEGRDVEVSKTQGVAKAL